MLKRKMKVKLPPASIKPGYITNAHTIIISHVRQFKIYYSFAKVTFTCMKGKTNDT